MFFDDLSPKKCFSSKNILIRYQALIYVYAYQISWWYSQNMYREKTPQNLTLLFVDFKDFACFGHGLESFLLKGRVVENPPKSRIFRFASVTFWFATFSKINIFS